MNIQNICYFPLRYSRKCPDCQNTFYYKDMLGNKAYKPLLFHCILLLFSGLLICQNIRITVKEEHNHNNPAEQTQRNIHFEAYSAQFHTSIRQYGTPPVPRNVYQSRNTILLLVNRNSYCAKECLTRIVPVLAGNNSWHR